MTRYFVGLAATFHDPALAIVGETGQILFAEATERKLQNKRAFNAAPDNMLALAGILSPLYESDADIVIAINWSDRFYNCLLMPPFGQVLDVSNLPTDEELSWPLPGPAALSFALRNSICQAGLNLAMKGPVSLRRFDHHLCHAALGAFGSDFEECVVAVVDGFGEWSSTGFFVWNGLQLDRIDNSLPDPFSSFENWASLGEFYGRLCALCRFDPIRGEEWKVMGLAPYGQVDPELQSLLAPMLRVDGLRFRRGCSEQELRSNLAILRERRRSVDSSPLLAADLAATGQALFEQWMFEILNNLYDLGYSKNIALVGGCALNSSCNGKILANTGFKHLYVPPAPGDDGTALGAALVAYHQDQPSGATSERRPISPYLGSDVPDESVENMMAFSGFPTRELDIKALCTEVAKLLAEGKIVAWMRGHAEYGPRALGNRSILADPRDKTVKDRINETIKFRESFRPFAPAILDECGPQYFEDYCYSPYMERTLRFRPQVRDRVPGVVHVDGSGRLQSVRRDMNQDFHALITAFFELTGIPLLLNTSLNIMGRPIADSVEDALGVFLLSGVDALVIGDCLVQKNG